MATKESYSRRLWSLREEATRSGYDRFNAAYLLGALHKDFNNSKQLFSAEEYRDPALRDAILDDAVGRDGGLYTIHGAVTRFIHRLIGSGPVLSLYSGFGNFLIEFGGGVGVESNGVVSEWAKLFSEISGIQARIITADPAHWQTPETYERIVAIPPMGANSDQAALLENILDRSSDSGRIAVVVPSALLWGARQEKIRNTVSKRAWISAVISLPSNVFPYTSIQTAVVVIEKDTPRRTYMAASKSLADLDAIAVDYASWKTGSKFSLGFEAKLEPTRWDISYYEPVDFDFGAVDFSYKVVSLADIADIKAAKSSPSAKIAVNRTGSKSVWIDDDPELIEKNNIFVTPANEVNASYLLLYLQSSVGKGAIKRFIKGAYTPHLSAGDLSRVPVVLPDRSIQNDIVENAIEVRKTVGALESLVAEGEIALKEKIFGLKVIRQKFAKFSSTTEKAFFRRLPFPIAVVYHKIANAPNNTLKFSLLIELFEVAVRLVALIHLADYLNARQQPGLIANEIPEVKKLYGPALGDWVGMFKGFTRFKSAPESKPFLEEVKGFKLDRYQRTLSEFVSIRNDSLRGHGATLSEDEYQVLFQEHAEKVYDLISSLGFLANYTLVKSASLEKDGDFYKIPIQVLMGDNPHFEQGAIESRTPVDTNRVLLINSRNESLVLDPYIVLERCPQCQRPEVLLLDKFSDKKITYLGYESGHKPAFENASRLPLLIREVAKRQQ